MEISDLRSELGLSHKGFATALGLRSRGQAHDLEKGVRRPSVPVALKLEELSKGRIKASSLNEAVALIERQRVGANDAPHSAEAA